MSTDLNEAELSELQARNSSTKFSLHDLRMMYYGGQVGRNFLSESDNIRAYLQAKTGSTNSYIRDLWRIYLVSQGVVNQVSLEDMMKQFFTGADLGPISGGSSNAGKSIGLQPMILTYAS